jgi:hypothetical protein
MTLIRKDKTYKLTDLPILKANYFTYNGQKGYTGSLIRRPVKGAVGLYKHTGLIYGYDINNTLWIIENNINGVECITFQDFALNMRIVVELNTHPFMIETIMSRAREKCNDKYHARTNNCENFTNYCLTGVDESHQTKNTEVLADVALTLSEVYLIANSAPSSILDNFTKIRNKLKLERSDPTQKLIDELLKRKSALEPPHPKVEGKKKSKATTKKLRKKTKTKEPGLAR